MPSYTSISKPTINFTGVSNTGLELLQEDVSYILQEDSSQIFMENRVDITSIQKPSTTYSNINKPS